MKDAIQKYTKPIVAISVFLGALTAISVSPYRLAFKSELDAVAAMVQEDRCVSKQMRLNDAYARRDDYDNRGEPVPLWLNQQIAELEVYIGTYC